MYKDCFVYKWDPHKTTGQQPCRWHSKGEPLRGNPVRVDHLWIYPRDIDGWAEPAHATIYEKCYMSGYIQEYTRSDGSKDLGLRMVPNWLTQDWEKFKEWKSWGLWDRVLQSTERILQTEAWMFTATNKLTSYDLKQSVLRLHSEAKQHLST